MARRVGDRNRDFLHKRSAILDALVPRVLCPDGARVTMNELAVAAGVSPSSLRHHLGGRSEVMAAVLDRLGGQGAPFLAAMGDAVELPPLSESVRLAFGFLAIGLQRGVLDHLVFGLAVGLGDAVAGPAFLGSHLEPMVGAVERRLSRHVERGDLPACDVRVAALSMVSPLLVVVLHQRSLGGCGLRPIDLDAFVNELSERFLRAWGPAASS